MKHMYRLHLFLWWIFLQLNVFTPWTDAENKTIIKVPYKENTVWKWPWKYIVGQWSDNKESDGKIVYSACHTNPSKEPNMWMRSEVFLGGEEQNRTAYVPSDADAKRIDVTVEYAVIDCYNNSYYSIKRCKENLNMYVYKTAVKYGTSSAAVSVPEPYDKSASYELFGSTFPKNLTTTATLSRVTTNIETYSFLPNSTAPYYYLAIQYQGGCFMLYSVTISYSVCPSFTLPTGLIQLPQTIAPVNGSIQVNGSCAANSQPLADNITLYGHCMANGEWSSQAMSGECWCKAGYGKYLNGPGAVCKACPLGLYQDKPSSNACKPCPLNSTQDEDRTKCNCDSGFYRTKDDTDSDNCTAQPSAPQNITIHSLNASLIVIQWLTPLNLGGRSDEYYDVNCKKCDQQGKNCISDCTGAAIIHIPITSRQATIQYLSPYTFYQFKVFAKNGVTHLAEIKGEKSKCEVLVAQTAESFPGVPVLKVKGLNSTSVELSWDLVEKNGVIIYYQITYYPVGEETEKRVLNASEGRIVIHGLVEKVKYFFQVRASTSVGLGQPGNITGTVALPSSNRRESDTFGLSQDQFIGVIVGIAVVVILIIILVVFLFRRKTKQRRSGSKLHLTNSEFIPLDGHRMYIDPSTYGSPMEALMSNATEINFKDLKLDKNIGGGEFADVYKGNLTKDSKSEVVAVKILKPKSSAKNKEDFILEASIMGQFKHPNVVELKGVVTRSPDSPMMIVTEFMENGSLDHFLKLRDGKLTALQLVGMARGVADGMAYLSGMNFIHRDLAARNILVADNMAGKISDFGLSRELDDSEDNPNSEYQTQGGKIPIRWTAPEAIRYRKFSSASDVWSFGILLWEIMSFSERPYWDWDNFQVMERVETGYRLPAPMNCPNIIHNIMLDCWEKNKNDRPKFADIVKQLDELIRSPDKINDEQASRFSTGGTEANLGEDATVEDWLHQINMSQYADNFEKAGYVNMDQVKALNEEDLRGMGVKLIGHRNKMSKSIKSMK